jgi:hypothetical protein
MTSDEFLDIFGPPSAAQPVDPLRAQCFAGRVPADLIAFWTRHGIGAYAGGFYHLCTPDRFDALLARLLAHAPVPPGHLAAVGCTAFGTLDLWQADPGAAEGAGGRHLTLLLPYLALDDQTSRRVTAPVPHDVAELYALAGVPMPDDPDEVARAMALPPPTVWEALATGASDETWEEFRGDDGRPLPAAVMRRLGPAGPEAFYWPVPGAHASRPGALARVSLADAAVQVWATQGTFTRAETAEWGQRVVSIPFPRSIA